MSVNAINKITNLKTSYVYNSWISEVVNKGRMDDYIILKYPDLVKIVAIETDGQKRDYKVIAKREVDKTIKNHPDRFEIIDLDLRQIELNDLKKSRSIKNKDTIEPIRNRIFYVLSFLFLAPLFSTKVRTIIKRYIDENVNIITVITGLILIILTLYMISLMR